MQIHGVLRHYDLPDLLAARHRAQQINRILLLASLLGFSFKSVGKLGVDRYRCAAFANVAWALELADFRMRHQGANLGGGWHGPWQINGEFDGRLR